MMLALGKTGLIVAQHKGGRMNELNQLRIRGVLILTMLGWTATSALLLLTLLFDFRNEMVPVAFSTALTIVPTYYALRERYDDGAGTVLGIMAGLQPAMLIYMLQGHPWQMEAHMFFFVGLAALTLVCDWKPIAVASGLIAVHHLLLGYFAPEWVFIGSSDFMRAMLQTLTVAMALGVLGPMMVHMGKLFVEQSDARAASETSASSAREALEHVRLAKEEVEAGQKWIEMGAAAWPTRAGTSCSHSPAHSKARSRRSSSRSVRPRGSWRMPRTTCIASPMMPASNRRARPAKPRVPRRARCACRPVSATCRSQFSALRQPPTGRPSLALPPMALRRPARK
jgi:hypothetical protein